MWKIAISLLTLFSCGINAGNIHRNGWHHTQEPAANQPSYYAPILHDFASYHQKLQDQGLAPIYSDLNPPFILQNSFSGYQQQYNYEQPQPTQPSKGNHKFNHIAHKVDDVKKKDCEHAKKPIAEIDVRVPDIKHETNSDKVHATASEIVNNLNETLNKIGDQVEVKVSAIKQLVDKGVDNINKTAGAVYQQIENESSKLLDKINQKLKSIEEQLEGLKFRSVKSVDELENFEDDDKDATRAIDDNQSTKANVVHSEIGKKLRSLELLDMDKELRTDLKSSISDAVEKAQDKFNKLIDEQVTKINNKISAVSEKFEATFKKFYDALSKLPKPTLKPKKAPTSATTTVKPKKVYVAPIVTSSTPKYTTITWQPKPTTAIPKIPEKFIDKSTTPEYYKYTVQTPKYTFKGAKPEDYKVSIDLNRMDANVDDLEIVDDAKDDEKKSDDTEEAFEEIDNLPKKIDTADTAVSLDELQSQVLETIRDTLKSEDENQSEVLDDFEEKLKSDMDGEVVEGALAEELRNEPSGDNSFFETDEEAEIDKLQEKDSDDAAKMFDDDEYEATTTRQGTDDSVKSLEIDEDEGTEVDGNEMRAAVDEGSIDIDEEFPEQSGNSRFDELEVIQLIPVIIEQLKLGRVTESEKVALEQIFGDLWSLIEAEANRLEGEEMNPLLKTILQSEEVRLAKRDITKQIGNDIFKNSVRRVYRGDGRKVVRPYISIDDDRKLMTPSERLLNMVAAIVHKANVMEKEKSKLRQRQKQKMLRRKKAVKNPLGIVTVEKPRHRFVDRILGINRMKRSLIKFGSDLADMRTLLEQVNQANDSEEDEEDENENEVEENDDDYVNDDYYYDDDYQTSLDTSDYLSNNLGWQSKRVFDDYENGSVNEFIQLAKQRDRREQNSHLDEAYDDDDDDDDY